MLTSGKAESLSLEMRICYLDIFWDQGRKKDRLHNENYPFSIYYKTTHGQISPIL